MLENGTGSVIWKKGSEANLLPEFASKSDVIDLLIEPRRHPMGCTYIKHDAVSLIGLYHGIYMIPYTIDRPLPSASIYIVLNVRYSRHMKVARDGTTRY